MSEDKMIDLNQDENLDSNDNTDNEILDHFSNNPMMDRVQIALRRQLEKTNDRVKRELREQEESFRMAKKEREDCGVLLYGMQQQLARLQNIFSSLGSEHEKFVSKRSNTEKSLELSKENTLAKKKELENIRKANSKCHEELDAKLETVRQAKKYNQDIKGDVAVARRAAYKAEDDVKDLEKGKTFQDLYIDSLNEQIKRIQMDVSLYDEQIANEREQSRNSNSMLSELVTELELLTSEKRQLVQQWKSSVLALNRRDQALLAANNALNETIFSMKGKKGELIGYGRDIAQIINENESLSLSKTQIMHESKYIDDEIRKIQEDQETMAHHFDILQNNLQNKNEEEKQVKLNIEKMKSEISRYIHKIESITRERKEFEDRIGTTKYEQANMTKAVKNFVKDEKAIVAEIHAKEIEAANIQNELARIKIDTINTEIHISQLNERLEAEKKVTDEITQQITQYEIDIRRRNGEIEKKMNRVDLLNRKYQTMLDTAEEEEPMGPLEATIRNLQNEIEKEEKEVTILQKKWVSDQTALIQTITTTDEIESQQTELSAKLNILNHKRMRLLQDIHSNEMEAKAIDSTVKGMHQDMTRLNELIGKHSQINSEFGADNIIREKEINHEMEEEEKQSNSIKAKLMLTKSAKDKLLDDILEAEKNILHWEKKIQLENETQVALNSSDQAKEIKCMEKEIQRMKHTLEALKREQEKLIREMELAIHKREDISIKYKHSRKDNNTNNMKRGVDRMEESNSAMTCHDVKQKKSLLKKQIQEIETNISKLKIDVKEMNEKNRSLTNDHRLVETEFQSLQKQNDELQSDINNYLFEKQRVLAKKDRLQSLHDKFQQLQKNNDEVTKVDEYKADEVWTVAISKLKRVQNAIEGIRIRHPKYDDVFHRVTVLLSDIHSFYQNLLIDNIDPEK